MCVLETRKLNAEFGSSLLLANSPMSPKIVNGSFAAIFDLGNALEEEGEQTNNLKKLLILQISPGNPTGLFRLVAIEAPL